MKPVNLIKPSYEVQEFEGLYFHGNQILKRIEKAGRTCYKSEARIDPESSKSFVNNIILLGHESVLEHEKITVRFICDRGISHELVRHRLASFSQESTRYCDYQNKGLSFVIPPWCPDILTGSYNITEVCNLQDTMKNLPNIESQLCWVHAMQASETMYLNLRKLGWKPEEARTVLPNSLKTEIVVSANLREWRHIFKLRTNKKAHPQMREIMIPLLKEFQKNIPVVFDDILL
jgi:thymidylate synthase (FAD)